jgi:hypothetical protein
VIAVVGFLRFRHNKAKADEEKAREAARQQAVALLLLPRVPRSRVREDRRH